MSGFIDIVKKYLVENGINWLITAIVTFFSVRFAVRRYYDASKVKTAKSFMEQGIKAVINSNDIPHNAQSIFVEYKGRALRKTHENKCTKLFQKTRRTICSVGGNDHRVSYCRPRDYGVLGVANYLNAPVVFDFKSGKLQQFSFDLKEVNVNENESSYYFVDQNKTITLSDKNTDRDIMIAIPLKKGRKFVGGVTFDIHLGSTKIAYKRFDSNDTKEEKQNKKEENIYILSRLNNIAECLVEAYFNKPKSKNML